jgi:hypothetical protein
MHLVELSHNARRMTGLEVDLNGCLRIESHLVTIITPHHKTGIDICTKGKDVLGMIHLLLKQLLLNQGPGVGRQVDVTSPCAKDSHDVAIEMHNTLIKNVASMERTH